MPPGLENGKYTSVCVSKTHFVEVQIEVWLELKDLGLAPGVSVFIKGVKLTKINCFVSFNVACKWKGKILGVALESGGFIFTNLNSLESAITFYKSRFDLEEMCRNFKSGGDNLENKNVSGERLIVLILWIAIAYTSATIQGQEIKHKENT